jgi:hypothetical protein
MTPVVIEANALRRDTLVVYVGSHNSDEVNVNLRRTRDGEEVRGDPNDLPDYLQDLAERLWALRLPKRYWFFKDHRLPIIEIGVITGLPFGDRFAFALRVVVRHDVDWNSRKPGVMATIKQGIVQILGQSIFLDGQVLSVGTMTQRDDPTARDRYSQLTSMVAHAYLAGRAVTVVDDEASSH